MPEAHGPSQSLRDLGLPIAGTELEPIVDAFRRALRPGPDWRAEHVGWPTPLAELEYYDRRLQELADRPPLVTAVELDEDVGELKTTLDEVSGQPATDEAMPPGLDGALQAIFEDVDAPDGRAGDVPRKPAAELIRRLRNELAAAIYRWTGHFPERTRP